MILFLNSSIQMSSGCKKIYYFICLLVPTKALLYMLKTLYSSSAKGREGREWEVGMIFEGSEFSIRECNLTHTIRSNGYTYISHFVNVYKLTR